MYDYVYYDYGNSSGVNGILSTVLITTLFLVGLVLIFGILMLIGQWKCFKKAGYKGWETLITGHNQFVNCSIAGINPIYILVVMFGSIITIVPVLGWIAYLGFLIYYQIILGINTAKAFGRGIGFGIALAIPLSAPIAWFILGADKYQYVGVKSENNNMNESQNVQSIVEQQPVVAPTPDIESIENNQPVFCADCGNALMPNAKFCTNCGKQV